MENGLPSRSSTSEGWLREMDSHHRLRFQRATSSYYSIPQLIGLPSRSPSLVKLAFALRATARQPLPITEATGEGWR
jgi:hypothetical protein